MIKIIIKCNYERIKHNFYFKAMSFFKFIPTMTTGVVQTFGRFTRLARPGLRFYIPFIESMNLVSNRLNQNHFTMQVRTADKVFPQLDITLQYRIKPEDT